MHALRLLPAILLLVGRANAFAGVTPLNEYVGLEVRLASTTMRPGSSGVVEFRFSPVEGIHVNVDPPVQFSLDSSAGLTLKGKPVMTTDRGTGYLSTTAPVKQTIVLGKKVVPGRITMKGTVTYYFCSESEGWCNRQKEPVEFTITVKP